MPGNDPNFVHLHVHTDFSLLDGACRVDRLMERAKGLGMGAIAMTDHGNLFGAINFYNAAARYGLKPLIGCEVYLTPGSRLEKVGRTEEGKSFYHMGLLARNETGYRNLLKLVSDAHLNGFYYKPRTDFETLAAHADGLIGFSGCLAALVPCHLKWGDYEKARQATGRFVDIFGRENYFIEVMDHGIAEQRQIIPGLLKLAREFDLKVVCTNDVHYVDAADAGPHDTMLCIQTGSKIDDANRMRYDTSAFFLKSRAEMEKTFGEIPEALVNTLAVAEMCDLRIDFPKGNERYPVYPMPAEVTLDRASYLRNLCAEGLKARYGFGEAEARRQGDQAPELARQLLERIDYEISIIESTGFVDYFLIVWDFIAWARSREIPVGPGRGSGAGCLVAYLLGITDIDPIRFKLLFERFLNPERVSPPDFDIDFCMRRRGEVIDYVREKYGKECVANIITFGTLGAKMVIRDVSRVHNLTYAEADRLAKMIPDELNISLEDAVTKSTELREAIRTEERTRRIVEQARVLEGMVRNTGKHAAGVIIADRPLSEFVPLTLQEGDVTVQYDMKAVEKVGLLKMDFLGLKTLTVIQDAVDNVRRTVDVDFDIHTVSFEDEPTFRLLNTGRTTGVFQLESGGMQALCRQLQVSSIDEIVALIALYRPGPMDWIPDYIRGKKDPSSTRYPHPLLEDVCRETYGIMVYQEQVMEAARIIAGYTLGGADMLRRAMGKKLPEEMERQREIFIKGAREKNGIDPGRAGEIFAILEKFAGYGFNKSHSAAYAVLSYQTAFLKANHPVQFMAAVLSNELGNADKVAHFIEECSSMGVQVLGPDVNESREAFTPILTDSGANAGNRAAAGRIRFGLAAIKGVGDAAAHRIIEERESGGKFRDFFDFLLRIDSRAINKRVLECLILTGGFDFSGVTRPELYRSLDACLAALGEIHRKYPGLRKDQGPGREEPVEQNLLFDLADAGPSIPPRERLIGEFKDILRMTELPRNSAIRGGFDAGQASLLGIDDAPFATAGNGDAATDVERDLSPAGLLRAEKELLGFYVSGHPMNQYRGLVEAANSHAEEKLFDLSDRTEFRLCGIASNITKKLSRRDNRPWAMFQIATLSGSVSVNMYAEAFETYGKNLLPETPVIVQGTILRNNDESRINVRECHPLDQALPGIFRKITWILHAEHPELPDFLKTWRRHIDSHHGSTRTEIALLYPDGVAVQTAAHDTLTCRLEPASFRCLRLHPAVAGCRLFARPIELSESNRRWAKK